MQSRGFVNALCPIQEDEFGRTVSETLAVNSEISHRFGNAENRFRQQSRIMLLLLLLLPLLLSLVCHFSCCTALQSRAMVNSICGVANQHLLSGFEAERPRCYF